MGRNRKTYDEKTKKAVAIEAIRERKTVQEIAAEYGISASMVTKWKQEFLDGGFASSSKEVKQLKRQLEVMTKEKEAACLELGQTQLMLSMVKKKLNLKD